MDEAEVPGTDEVLTPEQRATLAGQLNRLNRNLERQFQVIADQQAAERKAGRRRWRIVMAVVLLIIGGNVRVEMVRREQRQRDKAQVAAQDRRDKAEAKAAALAQCRRTNTARLELRSSIDSTLATVETIVQPEDRPKVTVLRQENRAKLAAALPIVDCSAPQAGPVDEFVSCAEAEAAGATPLRRGDPGYSATLDHDGDGIACE